jgi:predicted NBD/HSP70 family sugar kinase
LTPRAEPAPPSPERGARKSGLRDTRQRNRALLLELLFHDGPMTRAEMVRSSGLTAPTVSSVVVELLDQQLVIERAPDTVAIGKPANVVGLNTETVSVLALELTASTLVAAFVRLDGKVVQRHEIPLDGVRGRAALDRILDLVQDLLSQAPDQVLAIGAGVAGVIDRNGVVRHAVHLDWVDVALAAHLSERFQLPAHVGNDINVAAIGARLYRGVRGHNLLLVSITHGVGAGLIVGNTLVEGEFFAAGEIAHVTIYPSGARCECGRRGCLEMYLGADNLRARLSDAAPAARTRAVTTAGRALAIALAGTVSALNLGGIVLAGPDDLVTDGLVAAAQAELDRRTLPVTSSRPTVLALGDDDLVVHGALSLVLAREYGIH